MSKRLEETKINRRKQDAIEYLIKHPEATYRDVKKAGLESDVRAFGSINNARKSAGIKLIRPRIPKSERKKRLLAYLREQPGTTYSDIRYRLKGSIHVDFAAAYAKHGVTINNARRDAGILRVYAKIGREKRKQKIEGDRKRVRDFLAENPDADMNDIRDVGLAYRLKRGYNNRINLARRELGLNERAHRFHANTLYSDIWRNSLEISPTPEMETNLEACIKPMLTQREFYIAKRYYGIGCKKQALEKIGKAYELTRERIRQILKIYIVPKLSYLNNQKAIANAVLPYVKDEESRRFLARIPEYAVDNFLPYRMDQLYFPDGYNPINVLNIAGIITIDQFLNVIKEDRKIKGFGSRKCSHVMGELNKFGIEPVYK